MCGRRSENCSIVSRMLCRVLLASFLLLFVAVSSLAAWPSNEKTPAEDPLLKLMESLPVEVEVKEEPVLPIEPQPTPSTNSSQTADLGLMLQLEKLNVELAGSKKVSQEIKDDFAILMAAVREYFVLEDIEDALAAENAAKLDALTEHAYNQEQQLVEQGKEIAEVKALLKKEKGSKPFMAAGLAMGFNEGIPQFGLSGQFGVRFGGSFTASLGGTYMVGSVTNPSFGLDLNKVTVTGLIGWEF